jgi:hypothetical protein
VQECPNFPEDLRAEQCAKYNGRNYKGRSYAWVPFVDGERHWRSNLAVLIAGLLLFRNESDEGSFGAFVS